MYRTIDVVDFGEIIVQPSYDNDDCVRLTLEDERSVHFDLDEGEVTELIIALSEARLELIRRKA